jgi:hypothetical protein
MSSEITRRTFLVEAGAGAAGLIGLRPARAEATVLTAAAAFKLSVTRWPFQELNYPAVMRAIGESGFTGYVAQEFVPTRDPRTSLAEAVRLCRV